MRTCSARDAASLQAAGRRVFVLWLTLYSLPRASERLGEVHRSTISISWRNLIFSLAATCSPRMTSPRLLGAPGGGWEGLEQSPLLPLGQVAYSQ